MDTIKITLQNEEGYLQTYLEINNKIVQSHIDPFSFLFYWKESTNREKDNSYRYSTKDDSEFYPLTCSCGIAGCEGIWNGILVKWRKNTVEWRFKNRLKDGYGNRLDKSFYSFDRKEYEQVAKDVFKFCYENQDLKDTEYNSVSVASVLDYLYDNYIEIWGDISYV